MKNHSKEEQDQLKLIRDSSQGKSTDNSQEERDVGTAAALASHSNVVLTSGAGWFGVRSTFEGQFQQAGGYEENLTGAQRGQFKKGNHHIKKILNYDCFHVRFNGSPTKFA